MAKVIEVHLLNQERAATHSGVKNAWSAGGFYHVYLEDGFVYKYPETNIFRIKYPYGVFEELEEF